MSAKKVSRSELIKLAERCDHARPKLELIVDTWMESTRRPAPSVTKLLTEISETLRAAAERGLTSQKRGNTP